MKIMHLGLKRKYKLYRIEGMAFPPIRARMGGRGMNIDQETLKSINMVDGFEEVLTSIIVYLDEAS